MSTEAYRKYQREWMRRWRATYPEKVREANKRAYWKNRSYHLSRAKAYYERNPDAWKISRAKNPERHLVAARRWALKHPEKVKALFRAWASQNKDKRKDTHHRYHARKNNATTEDCSERIKELYTCELCFWCKEKMNLITIDHVIPLTRGGEHASDNLVASCYSCNSSKGNKLPSEWLKEAA